MTHSYNDEAGDLLWKYIEELKQSENPDAVNFIARTSLDPVEASVLLPLAEDMNRLAQLQNQAVDGQAMARTQLLQALRDKPLSPLSEPSRWFGLAVPRRVQVAVLLLALLLAVLSIGYAINSYYARTHCVVVPKTSKAQLLKTATLIHGCPSMQVRHNIADIFPQALSRRKRPLVPHVYPDVCDSTAREGKRRSRDASTP